MKGKIYYSNSRPWFRVWARTRIAQLLTGSFSWVRFIWLVSGFDLSGNWQWLVGMGLGTVGGGWLGFGRWCWVGGWLGLGLAHLWEAPPPPSLGWLPASPGYSQEEWPPSEAWTQAQLAPHTSRTTPTPQPCHPCPGLLGQSVAKGRQDGVSQGPW